MAVRLSPFFSDSFGASQPTAQLPGGRSWVVTPFVNASTIFTDNSYTNRASGKQGEVIATVTPGISVAAESARIRGRAFYSPTFLGYLEQREQSRIDHRFLGDATIQLVPGSVFLDLRASAFVSPIASGFTSNDTATLPRRGVAQTYNFSVSPYFIHRFGTRAAVTGGYVFQYVERQGAAASIRPDGVPFYRPGNLISNSVFGAVRTGEDFGRFAAEFRVRGATFEGAGSLDGAHRASAILETRYALRRNLYAIVEGGYESIHYKSAPRIRIDEPVWGVGVRWDPSPNSMIIARYRRREGVNSPVLEARLALTARTTMFLRYDDGLATPLQRNADLLQTITVDENGLPVDRFSGAPQPDLGGSAVLGLQSGVFRIRRAQATIAHRRDRDSFSLNYRHEGRRLVANDPGVVAFGQTSNSFSLTYSRAVNPLTTFTAIAGYSLYESPGSRGQNGSWMLRASFRRIFSDTLSGAIEYQVTDRQTTLADSSVPISQTRSGLRNAIIVSLRKTF
ncbi:TIGR03016 family PEP-CTERM system-associated outer membrane protein [Sabulicella glaciei]|uniref:TIGR03016 family PEP-CTERM system-associated outer membrane protein n=1 Tax=Sabulicella glaciei TaxID=2984948 RepID=A0ABT3NRL3_9PROT|nr:TIGR03016 family PEP-CTERM system-associated outer membrane protein [Roseococcus sp. MDT2-1-1]MCW8084810.1 TIGR03016 family PEP-CTERM system-associated outer membrane protein [Roseococcus sp. MDT2-1-1]